ncbi:MAG TPA: DUF4265 domain-containing protein [Pyrinomonadaceae bacterium]|jgi:hypothetical protein|nr:DUF4265 domain-containing protein [Pyrinomonadaceae bacterium]
MSDAEESLTKVHIDLPNHWATGGESLWALPLGNDLYEIRNTPFHAYGINWGDVVRATEDDPTLKPEVREVVRPSGNKTLRVIFDGALSQEEQDAILSSLEHLDLSWERANDHYVAIDVHPNADYHAIRDKLAEFENTGVLGYETCEARVEGSFDDSPSDEQ